MDESIRLLTQIAFVLLFLLAARDFARQRDRQHLEIAVLFGSVALAVLLPGLPQVAGVELAWARTVGTLSLLAQPYLLLRLVEHFRAVPRVQHALGVVGLAFSWGAVLLGGQSLPRWASIAVVVAFVYVEAYATLSFARAAVAARGVTRRRLMAVALGSGLLAATILLAGAGATLPSVGGVLGPAGRLLALASAASYYLGFSPPGWLRLAWQAAEFRRFLGARAELSAEARLTDAVARLGSAMARLAGGKAGVLALAQEGGQTLRLVADASEAAALAAAGLGEIALGADAPVLTRAWRTRRAVVSSTSGSWGPALRGLAWAFGGAEAALAVPLDSGRQVHGLVIVLFERPRLFLQDELGLVAWLAQHTAIALENAELYAESQRLVEQLRAQNAALEQASRLKSEFLANMSHELRTQLNAIIGFTELLLDEPEWGYARETRRTYLETVHESGQHLLGLINDILDLSKVEAGKAELRLEPFDAVEVVGRVLATVEPLAAAKRIALASDAQAAGELVADVGKFKQVLYNLLSNAIKFTPEGGSVAVEARRLADAVEVTVSDTGIGIAAEDQERVFQEFQQLDAGPGRQYEGTGLGLALARRFVELHGGRIWLESVPGQGSRFHFTLPLGARQAPPGPERGAAPAPSAVASPGLSRPLVLVVEDDPRAANLLTNYLGRGGYRIEVAADGRQALEKARALQPVAITLDILLPELDGWEVLRALKLDPATRDIPVVVVSVTDDQQLGYALGAVDYFVKPVDRQALLTRLGRYTFTTKVKQREVRVLVVDDDPAAVELLAGMLTPAGFSVLRAHGGREGIEQARAQRPDLILLDLMMPDLSGFQVVAALKADPATREIPILVITAKELSEQDKAGLNGHVEVVLQKGTVGRVELLAWLDDLARRLGRLAEVGRDAE